MPKLRPATYGQTVSAEHALQDLQNALTHAKLADCPRLCARIRLAISSARGAVRHVNQRHSRKVLEAIT